MIRVLTLLPIALALIVPVHATRPSLVTGTLTITSFSATVTRAAGNNMFVTTSGTLSSAGEIQGEIASLAATFVLHNSTGVADITGQATFTGTVLGSQPGSMDISITGNLTFTGPSLTSLFERWVLSNGTGGLAGIHGVGTVAPVAANTLGYSIDVHFDPA